ncbi:MAG: leucine-rich repeat domain-containing protein, partial [Bacteroidaceae bacterium]|nr:leucine-rich repeat domain-containing protein [Bacteroidaceae bacterium]
MRRLFAILFAVLVLNYVQAQTSGTCGDNLTWSLDKTTGALTISGDGAMTNYTSSAKAPWYDSRTSVKKVSFSGNITSIGAYAFYGTSLTSVSIPSGVTSIGDRAFYNCSGLTSIEIPNSVTNIGERAFAYCTSLRSVEIPSSVTSIGNSAFYGCTSLFSIISNIPSDKLFVPGSSAFGNVDKEKCTLAVPTGSKSKYASTEQWKDFTDVVEFSSDNKCGSNLYWSFNSTTGMLYIFGSGSMYSYDDSSSLAPWNSNKTKIKSVVIKSGVTSISSYAFLGCSSLRSIISEAPSAIVCGSNAFDGVSNCVLAVPSGLKSAYSAASGWKIFSTIDEYSGKCGSDLYWSLDTSGAFYLLGCGAMNNYTSSTSSTTPQLPWYDSCTSVKTVSFCGNITSLGNFAFCNCTSLTSVTIPSGVTSIGDRAFYNCSGLTSIEIPNSVTNIGERAFAYCTS